VAARQHAALRLSDRIGVTIVHRRLAEDVLIHLGFKQEGDVVAAVLAHLLTSYLVGFWLLVVDTSLRGGTSAIVQAILSLVVVLAMPLAAHIIRLIFKRFFGPLKPASADIANDDDPYIRSLMRAVWIALCVLAFVSLAYLGRFYTRQAGLADYSLRVLTNIAMIILLGYVGWALFQRWVDRWRECADADEDPSRDQRLQGSLTMPDTANTWHRKSRRPSTKPSSTPPAHEVPVRQASRTLSPRHYRSPIVTGLRHTSVRKKRKTP
jgi:hypothetical protein